MCLAKIKGESFDKLQLIESLVVAYKNILARLKQQGVEWIQIDEPVLVLDLPELWKNSFEYVYKQLQLSEIKIILATYFGALEDNVELACRLPVDVLHIDVIRGSSQLDEVLQKLPENRILSLGIVDGRNVWRSDLDSALETLKKVRKKLADRAGRFGSDIHWRHFARCCAGWQRAWQAGRSIYESR